jgi:hypothetical protein
MDFIDLDRYFVPLTKDQEPSLDIGRFWGARVSGWLGWEELKRRRRVILLAEAASGKTEEFRHQCDILKAAGSPAFFLRITAWCGSLFTPRSSVIKKDADCRRAGPRRRCPPPCPMDQVSGADRSLPPFGLKCLRFILAATLTEDPMPAVTHAAEQYYVYTRSIRAISRATKMFSMVRSVCGNTPSTMDGSNVLGRSRFLRG